MEKMVDLKHAGILVVLYIDNFRVILIKYLFADILQRYQLEYLRRQRAARSSCLSRCKMTVIHLGLELF